MRWRPTSPRTCATATFAPCRCPAAAPAEWLASPLRRRAAARKTISIEQLALWNTFTLCQLEHKKWPQRGGRTEAVRGRIWQERQVFSMAHRPARPRRACLDPGGRLVDMGGRQEATKSPVIDRAQHRSRGPLDDLVLKGGDRDRALPTIRLGYVNPPRR